MKIHLVGLAISFALPTFAQQKEPADPQLRQKLVDVIRNIVAFSSKIPIE